MSLNAVDSEEVADSNTEDGADGGTGSEAVEDGVIERYARRQDDDVEDEESRGVLCRELADEPPLVRARELLEVVRELGVDRVDCQLRAIRGELPEELARAERVVRVFVVERDGALVRVEDVPVWAQTGARRSRKSMHR